MEESVPEESTPEEGPPEETNPTSQSLSTGGEPEYTVTGLPSLPKQARRRGNP